MNGKICDYYDDSNDDDSNFFMKTMTVPSHFTKEIISLTRAVTVKK